MIIISLISFIVLICLGCWVVWPVWCALDRAYWQYKRSRRSHE